MTASERSRRDRSVDVSLGFGALPIVENFGLEIRPRGCVSSLPRYQVCDGQGGLQICDAEFMFSTTVLGT